jgi:arylsulfatase A-like enzyme
MNSGSQHLLFTVAVVPVLALCVSSNVAGAEPMTMAPLNILWLSAEDISPHLGCYGDPHAITPRLDRLAEQGVRYTHAFTTAGVCAPCRSGIITGVYQTTLGTHHMRCQATLPDEVVPFPLLLRQAGYYCSNQSKTDYQFVPPAGTWDESSSKAHWRNRKDRNQPFFSVFNFTGCHESGIASAAKYRSVTANLSPEERQNRDELTTLPPYYPETATSREDWKRNYELITALDHWVGDLLDQLEEDGLAESTIVFFWSDHGVGLPRAKRWLYDSGTRIPLIIRAPQGSSIEGIGARGSVDSQLVSSIDFAATVLNLAGIKLPESMQGRPFLGTNLSSPRTYVYGARDRMDERYDIIRMVRDKKFKYLKNYEPLKSYYQYMNTSEKGAIMAEMRQRFDAGELHGVPARYFAPFKPVEELYDTEEDPNELNNLAGHKDYQEVLRRMRTAHQEWVVETLDLGLIPEPLIEVQEKTRGSRYLILRDKGTSGRAAAIADTALWASGAGDHAANLLRAVTANDPAVRYWAYTGLGNLASQLSPIERTQALVSSEKGIRDASPVVQVAAARALCLLDQPDDALPVLSKVLANGRQWERLHSAIVLDEIDEMARPVVLEMHKALEPREELFAKGKYTVRVINRALNQLEGTERKVP